MSKKSKKKKFKISRKALVTTVIVVVVLAAAIAAGVIVQLVQRQSAPQDNPDNANDFTISGGPPLPKAVIDSQNLAAEGKANEANNKIEDALKANPGDDTKYELYVQQGINLQNANKLSEAMEQYRKAEVIKQDFKITRLIAQLAESMGNKPLAIEYYRKAIPLIDPESPLKDADKRRLEAKIKELGG